MTTCGAMAALSARPCACRVSRWAPPRPLGRAMAPQGPQANVQQAGLSLGSSSGNGRRAAPLAKAARGIAGARAAEALAEVARAGETRSTSRRVADALREAGEELCPGSEGLDALRKQTAGASGLSDELTLDAVRQNLIRQEDSIIFALIERAQYKMNAAVYATETLGAQSLLEFTLREQERTFAKIRRYTDDVERAFFPEALPPAILPALSYPETLHPAARAVNLNAEVMALYLRSLLPALCDAGDDANYGSAAMHDTVALQALSKRVHYGLFVAESKFQAEREVYEPLIKAGDAEGLMATLTNVTVEEKVLQRVKAKAAIYGQDLSSVAAAATGAEGPSTGRYKVEPQEIASLYETWIMPLTKQVQVAYLLRRLDDAPQ